MVREARDAVEEGVCGEGGREREEGGAQGRGEVAWAWAANGFASVIGAPFGALIGLEAGSRVLFLAAGAAYALAGMVQWLVLRGGTDSALKELGARVPP